jgi:hypothetical protein
MIIERIIRSLDSEELGVLRSSLALNERSRSLFEYIVSANGQGVSAAALCKEFRISESNLYRICSELTDECIRILASAHEYSRAEFFRQRYLYEPFITEIARTERRLIREKDAPSLEHFYRYVFSSHHRFPLSEIDLTLLEGYAKKWARVAPPGLIDFDLYTELRVVLIKIAALPSRKKMTLDMMRRASRALLDPLTTRAVSSNNPEVRFQYFQAEWKASNYDDVIGEDRLRWLRRSIETVEQAPKSFSATTAPQLKLNLAHEEATYIGHAPEALDLYDSMYRAGLAPVIMTPLFFIQYIRVAILARKFERAHELIAGFEADHMTQNSPGLMNPLRTNRTVLEILEGDLDAARTSIAAARATNSDNNFFFQFEIEIRSFEMAIALKGGDFRLADQLAERNIKWLYSRRYTLSQQPLMHFFKIVRAIVGYKLIGVAPRPSIKAKFEQFRTVERMYAMLIEEEVAEMFPEVK